MMAYNFFLEELAYKFFGGDLVFVGGLLTSTRSLGTMSAYWVIFFLPMLVPVLNFFSSSKSQLSKKIFWNLIILIFILFIGLRRATNNDWFFSKEIFDVINTYSISDIGIIPFGSFMREPVYEFFSWLVGKLGLGYYGLNTIFAIIFMTALSKFALRQPKPWIVLVISVPYMILVLAMGFTRQATAFSFILLAIMSLSDQKKISFLFWIFCATLFHNSSIIMSLLIFLTDPKLKIKNLVWPLLFFLTLTYFFYSNIKDLFHVYLGAGQYMFSKGAWIRLAMSLIPVLIFFKYSDYLTKNKTEKSIFLWISIFIVACIPLAFIASAFTDRLLIYFMSIQLFVYSRILFVPVLNQWSKFAIFAIVFFYASYMFFWLKFSPSADYYLPYKFICFNCAPDTGYTSPADLDF